jgi:hypothetical protein
MKKLFPLIVILIVFTSCTTDVKFNNNPGFQSYKDNVLWKGIDVRAYKSTSGKLRIVALADDQELELSTASDAVGTYLFGTTNLNTKATYTSTFDNNYLFYSTEPVAGPVSKIVTPMISAGTGYEDGIGIATTGGSGTGLTVQIKTDVNGAITEVKIASSGIEYLAGDIITITGGNNNAKFKVLNTVGTEGEIKITENDLGTISGTFKFNGRNVFENPTGSELVNFQYGQFYKIAVYPEP